MSTTPKLLFAALACSTFIVGCSTPQRSGSWEYKTITIPSYDRTLTDTKLNQLAAEGWEVVAFSGSDSGSSESTFVLKKRK